MNLFVTRLTELLAASGKMQKEICSDMNISRQKLSKWKTAYNEPSIDEIIMIAKYFEVSTDFLLDVEDEFGIKKENKEETEK